jgi:hypothetical protein
MKKLIFFLFVLLIASTIHAENKKLIYGAFSINHDVYLPGKPEVIYDAITGDISDWWDHSFSEKPSKFYIDAKPGGGFYEIFDESGDGILHATVIAAQRGKLLRFDGPLGLSGKAIKLVTTYDFKAADSDSTLLKVTVNGSGEYDPSWPPLIDNVWQHFIFEQFKPYIESEKYLEKVKK